MLKEGKIGLLVGAQNTDELRKAIEMFSGDVGERQKMAASAYTFVQANYSLDRMCQAYRQVYNETFHI